MSDHVLCLHRLALSAASALPQSGRFARAILNTRFHHAEEAPDPVGLFVLSLAELLETIYKLGRCFAAVLDLLFDLFEEQIKLEINLEQGMLLCYGCHNNLRLFADLFREALHKSQIHSQLE